MGKRPTLCVRRVSINPDGKLCSPSLGYAQEMDIFYDEWEMFLEMKTSVLDAPVDAFPKNAPLADLVLNKNGHLLRKIQ